MRIQTRKARTGFALVLPLLIGCLIFYGIPFALVLWFSVVQGHGPSAQFVGLNNYASLFGNPVFLLAAKNTLCFLLIGLTLILLLSYTIALMLQHATQRSKLLQGVLLLPYVMPVVGTVVLVDVLFTEAGLWDQLYALLDLPVQSWLEGSSAFWITVGLYLWKNTGYSVILLLSGLMTIPPAHYEAAELDGASGLQKLRYITFPQMWYSIFFAGVFSLINAFKCFREIFLIGGEAPNESIYMLQHFINNSFHRLSYSKMAAASILLTAFLCGLFALCYRLVMRKEAYKG